MRCSIRAFLWCCFGVLTPFGGAWAQEEGFEPSATVQVFEQAPLASDRSAQKTNASGQAVPTSPVSNTSVPKVDPVEEKTSNTQISANETGFSPKTQSLSAGSPVVNNSEETAQAITLLQTQLTQLNQNVLLFEERVQGHLDDLKNNNNQLEDELVRLKNAFVLMNQELMQIKQNQKMVTGSAITRSPSVGPVQSFLYTHHNLLMTLLWLLLASFVILIGGWMYFYFSSKRIRNNLKKSIDIDSVNEDTKDEYDYMGSVESIPAKLNLVRTYLAMEDYTAARKLLTEIIEYGDVTQREEAQELLRMFPVGQA